MSRECLAGSVLSVQKPSVRSAVYVAVCVGTYLRAEVGAAPTSRASRSIRWPLSGSTCCAPRIESYARSRYQPVYVSTSHSNCSITISGFDPSRSGGPQVPAPLEVNTCILPILLNPYTNW